VAITDALTRGMRPIIRCGAAMLALGPVGAMQAARADAPQSSGSSNDQQLETITVTTQKRAERLQDVPLSIASKTGDQLEQEGVTTVRDLPLVTPGLVFDTGGGGFVLPSIRGISTGLSGQGEEANVATYVDGFYKPEELANTYDLPDIDRVEVDKGPQGTLFGRNATGGAIQIFTLQPSFTPTGHATLSYGNFNDRLAKGYVTGPLAGDQLAGSLSAFYEIRDGYNHDILDGGRKVGNLDSKLVRGKFLWRPADWASFTLTAQYMNRLDNSSGSGQALNGNATAAGPPYLLPRSQLPTTPWNVALSLPGYLRVKSSSFNLRSEFDLSLGTLTSLTQYEDDQPRLATDTDFSAAVIGDTTIHEPNRFVTQELDFASRKLGNWLSFIAGAFYYDDTSKFDPLVSNQIVVINSPVKTKSYAGFAEATAELTDHLSVIGGARYTWERKEFGINLAAGGITLGTAAGSKSWNAVTPRASVIYKLNDSSNAYFTYSQGFKSGGINTYNYATTYTWNPEKVQAYELGLKSLLTDRLSLNAAGFYYKYTNQQVLGLLTYCTPAGCVPIGTRQNAASSTIYGLDVDATARVTDELSLVAGLSLLHARFDSFDNALVDRPRPLASCPDNLPCGNTSLIVNDSGKPLPRAPDWTVSLEGNYVKHFAPGRLALNLSLYTSARFYYDTDERIHQPGHTMVNARASWEPERTNLTVTVWGKNLTNKALFQSVYINDNADGVSYQPPRTYGVSVDYKL
jgi:iron complex outermembrane receptor protein